MATKPPVMIRRNVDLAKMEAALSKVHQADDTLPAPVVATGFAAVRSVAKGMQFIVGQISDVPLSIIQKSKCNARVFYNEDELDEMAHSLSKNGQEVAAIGFFRGDKVILVDGQKRFQAATRAGIANLRVEITEPPKSDASEYEESRRINLERSTQTALDDAVRWSSLISEGVYKSQDDLARALGCEKAAVSKTIGITRIPERLLRHMSKHPKTQALTIAYEVSVIFDRLASEPEKATQIAEDVIEAIAKFDMTRKQTIELINTKISGPSKRSRAESTAVKFGESKGILKIFPSKGQLDLSFKGLNESKLNELKHSIETILSKKDA